VHKKQFATKCGIQQTISVCDANNKSRTKCQGLNSAYIHTYIDALTEDKPKDLFVIQKVLKCVPITRQRISESMAT